MNKTELIDALSVKLAGDKKMAAAAIEGVIDVVTRSVAKGERVAITGFGVFDRKERPARMARNPRTGISFKMKKLNIPVFRPGQGLRDVVSGAKKLPKVTPAKAPAASKVTASKSTASKAAPSKATASPAKSAPAAAKVAVTTAAKVAKSATKAAVKSGKSTAAKSTAAKSTAVKGSTAAKSDSTKSTAKKSPAKASRKS